MIAFPSTSTNIPPLQLGAVSNIFWRVTMCGYERGASECMQFYMRRNAMWKTALCKNQSSPSIASAGANAFCTVLLYASTLTSHKVNSTYYRMLYISFGTASTCNVCGLFIKTLLVWCVCKVSRILLLHN